jgi:hypothetical protein
VNDIRNNNYAIPYYVKKFFVLRGLKPDIRFPLQGLRPVAFFQENDFVASEMTDLRPFTNKWVANPREDQFSMKLFEKSFAVIITGWLYFLLVDLRPTFFVQSESSLPVLEKEMQKFTHHH